MPSTPHHRSALPCTAPCPQAAIAHQYTAPLAPGVSRPAFLDPSKVRSAIPALGSSSPRGRQAPALPNIARHRLAAPQARGRLCSGRQANTAAAMCCGGPLLAFFSLVNAFWCRCKQGRGCYSPMAPGRFSKCLEARSSAPPLPAGHLPIYSVVASACDAPRLAPSSVATCVSAGE